MENRLTTNKRFTTNRIRCVKNFASLRRLSFNCFLKITARKFYNHLLFINKFCPSVQCNTRKGSYAKTYFWQTRNQNRLNFVKVLKVAIITREHQNFLILSFRYPGHITPPSSQQKFSIISFVGGCVCVSLETYSFRLTTFSTLLSISSLNLSTFEKQLSVYTRRNFLENDGRKTKSGVFQRCYIFSASFRSKNLLFGIGSTIDVVKGRKFSEKKSDFNINQANFNHKCYLRIMNFQFFSNTKRCILMKR